MLAYQYYANFYLARELNTKTKAKYQTLWVGDTVINGPWTLVAGLSYNMQSGKQEASSVAGPPFCPECIPGASSRVSTPVSNGTIFCRASETLHLRHGPPVDPAGQLRPLC